MKALVAGEAKLKLALRGAACGLGEHGLAQSDEAVGQQGCGFAPALPPLRSLIRRDDRGFAMRTDQVTSADQPALWFVGMRYDATGAIANIKSDSRRVARHLASWTVRRRLG